MEKTQMRDEYDFSKAKPNPYIEKLREQSTIRTDAEAYLKNQTDLTDEERALIAKGMADYEKDPSSFIPLEALL
jgi:hypothetical protein